MVTREVFWGIPTGLQNYFYMVSVIAVIIFFIGVWSRVKLWTLGRDDEKFAGFRIIDFFIFSIKSFFSPNCILAIKSFTLASYRGIMLLFIIWGFTTLFLGTVLLTLHHYSISFLIGNMYLIYSFALDVAGVLLLVGLVIAIGRRHLVMEVRRVTSLEDLIFLYLFLLIVVSGFMVEGMRLAILNPLNSDYSLGGTLFSSLIESLGGGGPSSYVLVWLIHTGSVLFFIAILPFTKFFHVFASQVSLAAAEKRYGGAIGGN
jgi:nitrate reductase gamma subunit